ncbi:MAG: diacylglycerol kinase family protein [Pirellulaceae bacterium]
MNELPDAVLICKSPKAGSGRFVELVPSLIEALRNRGVEVHATADVEQLRCLATSLQNQGRLKAVVAAGGDGTLSLVIANCPKGTAVMPLPLGTENLMARYLGHRPSVQDTMNTIMLQRTVQLDAATANDRLFLIMCSCGFDAEVVRRLHTTRRGHIWKLSYAAPILRSVFDYRFPRIRLIDRDNEIQSEPSCWAFVFNVPRYAAGLRIGAWADATDGWLDAITLDKGSVLHSFQYLIHILRNTHRDLKGTVVSRGQRYRIESADGQTDVPFQLDGDFAGFLPVDIEILPARVTLLLPQHCPVPLDDLKPRSGSVSERSLETAPSPVRSSLAR